MGDELIVTASSISNSFSPASDTCEISNRASGYAILPIVQKGDMEAKISMPDDASVMGVLYDANGRFVRSVIYKSDSLYFGGLAAGDYSLISMTSNTLLRSVLLMSTLDDMGLVDGTDYVKTPVHIEDGRVKTVQVASVPELDKEKLHFTSWVFFVADKNILNIGQYNTISTQVFFADKYAERVSNVECMVDIPDEIDFVDNSALLIKEPCSYRIENGHYIFPIDGTQSSHLRFSLKPKEVGQFRVTGSVRFTLDGVQTVQPIGTVWVQVNGFTLNKPIFVTDSVLRVSGFAPVLYKGQKVEVLDHDNLVGTTIAKENGEWYVDIEIPSSKKQKLHTIKARTITEEAGIVESDVLYVTYNDNLVLAERVVMLGQQKQPITFNCIENTVEPKFYTHILKKWWVSKVIPYNTTYTFLAYFKEEDLPGIRNNVSIIILASDGSTRTLDAEYDDTQRCYYASTEYPDDASKLPVSVYAYGEGESVPMSEEEKTAMEDAQAEAIEKTMKAVVKAAEKGEVEVLPSDEETLNLKYTVSGKDPFAFTTKEMDYDEAAAYVMENEPYVLKGDEGNMVYTIVNGIDEMKMIIVDADEHTAIRTVVSDAEVSAPAAMPRRKIPSNAKILIGKGGNEASDLLDLLDLKDYICAPANMDHMEWEIENFNRQMLYKKKDMLRLLNRMCGGDVYKPWFTREQHLNYAKFLYGLVDKSNALIDKMKAYQSSYTENLYKKGAFDLTTNVASFGLGKAVNAGVKISPTVFKLYSKAVRLLETENGVMISGIASFWSNLAEFNASDLIPDAIIPDNIKELLELDFASIYKQYERAEFQAEAILNSFDELYDNAYKNRDDCKKDCEEGEEGEDCDDDDECEGEDCPKNGPDGPDDSDTPVGSNGPDGHYGPNEPSGPDEPSGPNGPNRPKGPEFPGPVRPCIDPSGYIYEAVPSNRVKDATATIYYKDYMLNSSGNSTGVQDVMWDAENYGQVNPQITGADGMYQWDVPQGLWQVRVQKEGYQNNQTDWLPVPPPQLDINIPIVRMRLPKVKKVHAYEDAVTVEFDSYMKPEFLNTKLITVAENGNAAEGSIELSNEETGDNEATFASKLRFVPSKAFTANEVTLRIFGEVQNYSGIEMDEPFEAILPIECETKSLVADEKVKVVYGTNTLIRIKGEPAAAAAGKTVMVKCASGMITSAAETSVVLNNNGEAAVLIHGNLPGKDFVSFTMEET